MNEAKKEEVLKLLEGLTYDEIRDICDSVQREARRRCRMYTMPRCWDGGSDMTEEVKEGT